MSEAARRRAEGRGADVGTDEATLTLAWPRAAGPWRVEIGTPTGASALVLERGARLTLGSGRCADVRIDDAAVSALHASIVVVDGGVEVSDLGSKNGLYVGLARVGGARLAAAGASFVVGRTSVTVEPRVAEVPDGADPVPGMVGDSAAMRRVYAEIRRHARKRAPILIHGESGTGKDLVARALHQLSGRSGLYVALNAGAVSEQLADSELFGHCRGAFTGAVANRAGAFEAADHGTLFLDEVAELGSALQVRLLRVVEDGKVRAVGAVREIEVDVRLVSASFMDLSSLVHARRFRADLFHRISTVAIEVPALRQRRADIPALAVALLQRLKHEVGPKSLDSAAVARLCEYAWPGNVRELAAVLYRAASAQQGDLIDAAALEAALPPSTTSRPPPLNTKEAREVLLEHDGNVTSAARAAGVARSTFRSWLGR